jgi:hypothetical protein
MYILFRPRSTAKFDSFLSRLLRRPHVRGWAHQFRRVVSRLERRLIEANLEDWAVPTGLPPEQEKEHLREAFYRYPHFRANILRRLAEVETQLGNFVAAAAYRIRVVRMTKIDPFNDLIEAAELLVKSEMSMAARFIAGVVLSREYFCTEEARARAEQLLRDVSLPPVEPARFTVIYDRRTKPHYRVSYIFSLYNEEKRVEQAMKMYAQQTLYQQGEVEYIFVDSNSPQGEQKIFEQLVKVYPHVLYVKTEKRETLYQAWNRGIELSSGEFLGFGAPSECLVDDALQIMAGMLLERFDVDWVQGNVGQLPADSEVPRDIESTRPVLDCATGFTPLLVLLHEGYLTFTCSLFRRRIIQEIGMFDPLFVATGDTEFKLRFIGHGRVAQLGRVVGFYIDDGSPRLTVHPRAEIEHFIAEHRYLTDDHILKVCAVAGVDHIKCARACFDEMLSRSLSFRMANMTGPHAPVSNLELAEDCVRYNLAVEPDSARNWNDLAVLTVVNTLARCMDMLALGSADSSRVEQVQQYNRAIVRQLMENASQMSLLALPPPAGVPKQWSRPLHYGDTIW